MKSAPSHWGGNAWLDLPVGLRWADQIRPGPGKRAPARRRIQQRPSLAEKLSHGKQGSEDRRPRMMILLGVGANLPRSDGRAPLATCREAVAALQALPEHAVQAVSRWYETAPIPPSGQPPYVNGVVRLEGPVEPERLMADLQAIEAAFGRVAPSQTPPGPSISTSSRSAASSARAPTRCCRILVRICGGSCYGRSRTWRPDGSIRCSAKASRRCSGG